MEGGEVVDHPAGEGRTRAQCNQVQEEEQNRRRRGASIGRHHVLDHAERRAEVDIGEQARQQQEERCKLPAGGHIDCHDERECQCYADGRDQRVPARPELRQPVGQPAAQQGADPARDSPDQAGDEADFAIRKVEGTDEIGRRELAAAIAGERHQGDAQHHIEHGPLAEQGRDDCTHFLELGGQGIGRTFRRDSGAGAGLGMAPWRLFHQDLERYRDGDAGDSHQHEGRAPAEVVKHLAADHGAEHGAQRNAERIDRQRRGALLRFEIVADQRVGRRRKARLTDADAKPVGGQLGESRRRAAQGGEPRPDDNGNGDDVDAGEPLGQPGDRDTQHRIEQGEIEPAQQAQLGVGNLQVDLDGLADSRDDRPVDEIQRVGHHQQEQHEALVILAVERAGDGIRRLRCGGAGYHRRSPGY